MPARLELLANHFNPYWPLDADDILSTMTLFPFHAAFMAEPRKRKCADAFKMVSKHSERAKVSLGVSKRNERLRFLRFCDKCRQTDIEKHGETYWRRAHQIKGVLVCPAHGTPLMESDAAVTRRPGYADANKACLRGEITTQLSLQDIRRAHMVATRCVEFLNGQINAQWSLDTVPQRYRKGALSRGYIKGASECDTEKVEQAFVAFYGSPLLQSMGVKWSDGKHSSWIRNAFREHRTSFSTLEHALIQVFLENCERSDSHLSAFGVGPWFCPNPYVLHEHASIERLEIAQYEGHFTAYANCPCGFRFSFRELKEGTRDRPIILKKIWLSEEWMTEAQRLKSEGHTKASIQEQMDISYKTVTRLLDGKLPKWQASEQEIAEWKSEWNDLIQSIPKGSRELARRTNSKLYTRLRRYAKAELYAEPRNGPKTTKGRMVDWNERDCDFLTALKEAEQRLRADLDCPRRTRTALLIAANISPTYISNIERLPGCAKFLRCAAEEQADYYERKLRRARDKFLEKGIFPTRAKIRREAALENRARGERFEKVLREILSEHERSACEEKRNASSGVFAEALS
jgi:hypothetical protein